MRPLLPSGPPQTLRELSSGVDGRLGHPQTAIHPPRRTLLTLPTVTRGSLSLCQNVRVPRTRMIVWSTSCVSVYSVNTLYTKHRTLSFLIELDAYSPSLPTTYAGTPSYTKYSPHLISHILCPSPCFSAHSPHLKASSNRSDIPVVWCPLFPTPAPSSPPLHLYTSTPLHLFPGCCDTSLPPASYLTSSLHEATSKTA